MSDGEINNGYMDEEFGINMPAPQQAWQDMLTRLDDDMPAAAVPLPNSIVQVDNGLMRGITSLLGLLFITGAALLFSGRGIMVKNNNAGTPVANVANQVPPTQNEKATTTENKQQLESGGDSIVNNNENIAQSTGSNHIKTTGRTKITNAKTAVQNTLAATSTANNTSSVQPSASNINIPLLPVQNDAANTNVKSGSTTKPPAAAPQPGDESNNNNEEKKDSGILWQAGIWVKAQLPFSSAQHYFAGPNASSQPWRILLPGVWISAQTGKHLFEAEANPFAQTVYNPKPFAVNTVLVNGQIPATETKRLNKMFGISLSAGYSYNIGGAWWVGGRLQSTLLTKGVGNITVADGNTIYSNRFTVIKNSDTTSFQKFHVRLDAEAMYKANRWAAGARAGVYFSPSPIKYSNAKNPLETEIFFRWQLWRKR